MSKITYYESANIKMLKEMIYSFKTPMSSAEIKDRLKRKGCDSEKITSCKQLLYNKKVFVPYYKGIQDCDDIELERLNSGIIVNMACNYFQPFGANYYKEYENIEQYLRLMSGLSSTKINDCLKWVMENKEANSSGVYYVLNPLECTIYERLFINLKDLTGIKMFASEKLKDLIVRGAMSLVILNNSLTLVENKNNIKDSDFSTSAIFEDNGSEHEKVYSKVPFSTKFDK